MANTFEIKRNDTLPFIGAILKSEDTGSPINLSSVSGVEFNLSSNDNTFSPIFSGSAAIVDATGGEVQYEWTASDTNRSGLFLGEFEVVFSDNTRLSLPSDNSLYVKIFEDLDTSIS